MTVRRGFDLKPDWLTFGDDGLVLSHSIVKPVVARQRPATRLYGIGRGVCRWGNLRRESGNRCGCSWRFCGMPENPPPDEDERPRFRCSEKKPLAYDAVILFFARGAQAEGYWTGTSWMANGYAVSPVEWQPIE